MNKNNESYVKLAKTLEAQFQKKQEAGLLANLNRRNVEGLDVTREKILSDIRQQLALYENEDGEMLREEEKDYVLELVRKSFGATALSMT